MSVRSVSEERWRQAQEWELAFWRDVEGGGRRTWFKNLTRRLVGRGGGRDDWNHWWMDRFDGYRALPYRFDNYIELGCGPYTNSRLILRDREAAHVVMSDPLVRSYVAFRDTWLSRRYKRVEVVIDDHRLEECPFRDGMFDAAVLINVLDHVQDAELSLRNATRIIRPGGYFVFGQDLSNDEDVRNFPHDVGHPIRLLREDVEPHLRGFAPIIHEYLPRERGRNPEAHYSTVIFLGKKS